MVKKDFTEYERDTKDFTKKPLSKDFQKLIFPPESDVKKSEDHDPSVLPTSKLSMRKKAITEYDIDRLEEIKEELLTLMDEAKHLVRSGENLTYERARSYWIPHVIMALTKEHEYLGGSMVTMEDTIEELKEQLGPEEEEPTEEPEPKEASIKLNPKTGAWENLPKGWTEKSLKSFWNSLGGKGEHKVTRCIEKMEDKIDNPGAFCASLERRIESSNLEGKKLAVGDKILTSSKKKAKVVKVGTELAFWMSLDGEEFGSDFVNDIELIEPVEGGLTKEVPLEEKVDLGEKISE